MFSNSKFLKTLLSLTLLISGCSFQQASKSEKAIAFKLGSMTLVSYTASVASVNVTGVLPDTGVTNQSLLLFYTDSDCGGTSVGQGLAVDYSSTGIEIKLPTVSESKVYAAINSLQSCFFLGNYKFAPSKPEPPVLTSMSPQSPSRSSYMPALFGMALKNSVVYFYNDASCNIEVGSGSASSFSVEGITATLTANSTTSIYGKVVDPLMISSDCVLLTQYQHTNIGPDVPIFASISPVSPNNLSTTPTIKGIATLDSVSVSVYSDAACSNLLSEGSRTDFLNQGFQISVPENKLTPIYAKALDSTGNPSYCAFLTNYFYDNVKPNPPTFVSADPPTPTRLTIYPKIKGYSSSDTVTVKFYNSFICATPIGSGSKYLFESSGVAAGVTPNSITGVYAAAFDAAGNSSSCVSMLDYLHNTIPPDAPVFGGTDPVSPNNKSFLPLISGNASDTTVSLNFFSDQTCQSPIGTGTAAQFNTTGIRVTTPNIPDTVNTTTIYTQAIDAEGNVSDCTSLTSYSYSTKKADTPTFLQSIPNSPSRVSYSPWIIGTAPRTVSIVQIFKDSLCTEFLGSGSRSAFSSMGILVTLPANTSTDIYAISTDVYGNNSDCTFFTNYTHDVLPPLAPVFVSSDPVSPNNQSSAPRIKGSVIIHDIGKPLSTVAVNFYDSAFCLSRLGVGTPTEFGTTGIQIGVPANAISMVYAQSSDAAGNTSQCSLMLNYTHDTNPPGIPILGSLTPMTPSYNRNTIMNGSIAQSFDIVPALKVIFYRDDLCTDNLASGSASQFTGAGVPLVVTENATTNIYAQTLDIVGNLSNCVHLVDYVHSNIGPKNLQVSQNLDGAIALNWAPDMSASPTANYVVKRSLRHGGPYAVLAWQNAGSNFVDYTVKDGETYFYVVASTNNTGTSLDSEEVSLTSVISPVQVPTILQATGGPQIVSLQWNGFSPDMYYKILRAGQSGGPYSEIVANYKGTSYIDKTVLNNYSYYYTVVGVNASGESVFSNEASATAVDVPDGPTNLTATMQLNSSCGGSRGVLLTWASSPYFNEFVVKKSSSSGSESAFATVTGNTYTDCAPDPNSSVSSPTGIFYTVVASWGASDNPQFSTVSNEVAIRVAAGPDIIVNPGNNEIFVNWAALPKATSYQIWRSNVSGWKNLNYTLLDSAYAGVSYHDTSVINGNAYYYVVIANYQNNDEGWPSVEASGIPRTASGSPTNLVVIKDPLSNNPLLSWSAPSLYNSFSIYSASSIGGPYSFVGTSATNSYVPSLFTNGIYYFYVTAQWGSVETAATNIVSYVFGSPSTITATTSVTNITLAWSAVSGATSYNVFRSSNSGGPYTQISNTASSPFVNSSSSPASYPVVGGVGYFYVVQPVFSSGVGQYSSEVNGMLSGSNTPSGLTVTASDMSSVTLNWAAISGTSKYAIYKSTTANGTYALIGTTAGSQPNYTINGLSVATVYYFKVASNSCGTSCMSSYIAGGTFSTPAAPTVTAGNNSAEVSWSGVVGATSYNILRSTNNVTFNTIQYGATGGVFTDSTALNGNIYFYKIQAVYPTASIISLASAGVTPGVLPVIPQGLSVVGNTSGTDINLSWAVVPGASSYKVYLSTNSGGPWGASVLNTSSAAVNTLSNLTQGTLYYAVVTALNGSIESGTSSEISFIPFAQPPAPIALVTGTSVTLSWNSIGIAASYDVYRSSDQINYSVVASGLLSASYVDSTVLSGGIYYYEILPRIVNGIELSFSAPSNAVSLVNPPEPKNLVSQAKDANTIGLSWVASVSPQVVSYNIYRSNNTGGPYSLVDSVVSAMTQYQNTGLTPGQDYFYVVTAVNIYGGESIYSNEASGSLNPGPTSISALAGGNKINLTWSSVAGAKGYILRKGKASGGPYGIIANLNSGTSYQDNDIVDGVTYYYVVDAVFINDLMSYHSPEASATAVVKLNLQVPIELTDQALSSDTIPMVFERTKTSIDPNAYDGVVSYQLELVGINNDNSDSTVNVIDSIGNPVGSVVVPANTLSATRIGGNFTPNSTLDEYRLSLSATSSSDKLQVYSARILITQVGASKTKLYIPLLSSRNGPSLGDLYSPTDTSSSGGYSILPSSTIFKRDTSKLATLPNFNAWEFEVVVATDGGQGVVGLFDVTKGSIVEDSEVIFSNSSISLAKAPISEGAINFSHTANEFDSYRVAMQCYDNCSLGPVKIYKAGLWVSLTSLSKAEVVFRNALANFNVDPSAVIENQRTHLDLGLFSNPIVNFQAVAIAPQGGNTTVQLMSAGSGIGSDSGTSSLSIVSGSSLVFNSSSAQLFQTSTPLSVNSQDRFLSNVSSVGGISNLIDSAITIQISK